MKLQIKDLLLGAAAATIVLLAVGANNPSGTGRYQIEASGFHPDWFVLDTQTGQVWRYLSYSQRFDGDNQEVFELETFGRPGKLQYESIGSAQGRSWKGYKSRPGREGQ